MPPSRLLPMQPRDPREPGRVSSSLELFFDLVFAVAVSVASLELHGALAAGRVVEGLIAYALVFFGVWWAWMNFTWFATSFAAEDWLYRLLTILQMAGVLVLTAGIAPVFSGESFSILVFGYVVMRVAMVTQWLRAARTGAAHRLTTLIYAGGIAGVQLLWLLWLLLDGPLASAGLILLIVAELLVPVVAERNGHTPWHPHHITERYGLFTLILLGGSLLGSSNAVIAALQDVQALGSLMLVAAVALLATAALWWIYFWPPHHKAIRNLSSSLRYGYVHYFVFAAAGALSAGIELETDVLTDRSSAGAMAASFAVTVPIFIFIVGIWWIALRENADRLVNTVVPVGALLVLLTPVIPHPFNLIVTVAVLAGIVAALELRPPVQSAVSASIPGS